MDEIDIPQYFICPISLQIMKDPVIAISGITYDRESIEHWLSTSTDASCPITKQPLTTNSDLTPNHTLRCLIQAWCVLNAKFGVDRIPTPKSPLNKSHVLKLMREIHDPLVDNKALNKLLQLGNENEKNKACMMEAGVTKVLVLWVMRSCREEKTNGLGEALRIIQLIRNPTIDVKQLVKDNNEIIKSFLWVLRFHSEINIITHAILVMKLIIEGVSSPLLDRLTLDFPKEIVILDVGMPKQAEKVCLQILIDVCPWRRNRINIIESDAVFRLINLELNNPEKNITELIFCLLAHLCSCADGRAQILMHRGGIAFVAERILKVSPATDVQGLSILTLISRFSATKDVLLEILRVGAMSKLYMVLQVDCPINLKYRAKEVLKLHSNVWNNSSCVACYQLTK